MKLRDFFTSKAAGVALATGIAFGAPALADESDFPVDDAAIAETVMQVQQSVAATEATSTGYNVSIDNPHMPYAVIGGLGAFAVLLSLYGASQGMRGSWLRATSAVALSAAMLNPQLSIENYEDLPTEVAVIVDQSASQSLDGRDADTLRMQEELLRRLGELQGVQVRLIEAGDKGNSLEGPNGTHLFSSINSALANIPPSQLGAVIVLTDGRIHDASELQNGAAPVHVLVSGSDEECDRRIVLTNTPAFGVVDENVTIGFRVEDTCEARPVDPNISVSAYADGEAVSTLTVREGEENEFTFTVPHRGVNTFELRAEEIDGGEITAVNNTVAAPVEGIQDNLRVLVLSGLPNAGERSLRNLLKSDPAIDLVHFTILRHPKKQDSTPSRELSLIAVPTEDIFEQRLDDFDLVILDRWYEQGVLPQYYYERLAEYVREGGAMLSISGPADATLMGINGTSLQSVMPVRPDGTLSREFFLPRLTDMGERHPVARGLPGSEGEEGPEWGRWRQQIGADVVFGESLLQGDDERPLLVLGRKDDGRVAVLMSDSSWLWARGFEGGGPNQELMRRVAHWLLEEPELEEEALRLRVEDGKVIVERQTLKDETELVTLVSPSGVSEELTLEEVEPGIWQAIVEAQESGLYRAEQGEMRSFVSAGSANPRELENTHSTMEIMRSFAVESGGTIARMSDSEGRAPDVRLVSADEPMGGDDWLGVKETEAEMLTGIQKYSLFSGFLGLGLLMGALSVMWAREGGILSNNSSGNRRRTTPTDNVPKI